VSALYLNNKKVQAAKQNQNALKCFEMFSDFLENLKLNNTQDVFDSEANYKKNNDVRKALTENLGGRGKEPLIKSLVGRAMSGKSNTETAPITSKSQTTGAASKEETSSFKKQMDDLHAQSAKLDQVLERRKQTEDRKTGDIQAPIAPLPKPKGEPISTHPSKGAPAKQSDIAKFANILEDSQKFEGKRLKLTEDTSALGPKDKLKVPIKYPQDDSESEVSISSNRPTNSKVVSIATGKPVARPGFGLEKPDPFKDKLPVNTKANPNTLITNSHNDSNDFGQIDLQRAPNASRGNKESVNLNTETDDLVIQSQGLDNTVDSDILGEFDYVESIEKI
jgi:hypothetical protein